MKHEDGIELFLTDSEGNAYIDRPRNSWSSVPAQHTTRYSYMDVCVPPGTRFGICLQLSPAFKLYKEDALSLSMVESQPGAFHSFLLTRWSIDRLQSEDVGLQRLWIEQSKQGKYLEMPSATRSCKASVNPAVNTLHAQGRFEVEIERVKHPGIDDLFVRWKGQDGYTESYRFVIGNLAYPNGCSGCNLCGKSVLSGTDKLETSKDVNSKSKVGSAAIAAPTRSSMPPPPRPNFRTRLGCREEIREQRRTSSNTQIDDSQRFAHVGEAAQHTPGKRKAAAIETSVHPSQQLATSPTAKKKTTTTAIVGGKTSLTTLGKNAQADATNASHMRGYVDDDRDDEEIAPPAPKVEPVIKEEAEKQYAHPAPVKNISTRAQLPNTATEADTPDGNGNVQQARLSEDIQTPAADTTDLVRRLSAKVSDLEKQNQNWGKRFQKLESVAFRFLRTTE